MIMEVEASSRDLVITSPPPDPVSDADSLLSNVLYDASQQVQAGMVDLLKAIGEIDVQSSEVVEEIERCKDGACQRRKAIEDEKDRFQKAAFAVLDMLNHGDGKSGQLP